MHLLRPTYQTHLRQFSVPIRSFGDYLERKSNGAKFARFCRHTIQGCFPGVSTSLCVMLFALSQLRKSRLILI
jgi:hypothetical protein